MRARLSKSRGHQIVHLPKSLKLPGTEVLVHREGPLVILEPLGMKTREAWTPNFLKAFGGPPDPRLPRRMKHWE